MMCFKIRRNIERSQCHPLDFIILHSNYREMHSIFEDIYHTKMYSFSTKYKCLLILEKNIK